MPGSFDVVILGSGTTAFAAARFGAAQGARVLMVEQGLLGGTCVNWGCIPSKTLIDKAEMYHAARRGESWGLNLQAGVPDCGTLMALKRAAVEKLRQEHYQKPLDLWEDIQVLRGHGRFLSTHQLQVGAQVIHADRFLIATGGAPKTIPLPGLDRVPFLNSYSALQLPDFPESLLMLGGGVIALEMGQMLARFGTGVVILERGECLLQDFDPRLSELFRKMLEQEGVQIMTEVEAERVEARPEGVCLYSRVKGAEVGLCARRLMLAVGTAPATSGLGLRSLGMELNQEGFIVTDAGMRTSVPNIWAAGDVTGPPLIAPAGAREGLVAIRNMLDSESKATIDHRFTPMAVFVDPEFASVGLTLQQAEAENLQAEELFLPMERIPKAHVMGRFCGGVVMVAERPTGRILGCQLLLPRAADIIHEATLAVQAGMTVSALAATVHVYPSLSDGLRLAAAQMAKRLNLQIL